MPVHDWFRVDANVFHHFHQRWTVSICDALNAGLLPPGFSALVEQRAAGVAPDVLALERRSRPGRPAGAVGAVLTATPPKTSVVVQAKAVLAARGNRIVIRHRLGEIVCVLEIVSPGNKSGRAALRAFVEKSIEFLRQGIHLLVIDLLPPTSRDPQGMHKAIWDEIEEEPFELPPGKPLTLAAYVAGDLFSGIERLPTSNRSASETPCPTCRRIWTAAVMSPCRWKPPTKRPGRPARPICANWWKPESCPAKPSERGSPGTVAAHKRLM